jgi:hypothetical protein
MTAAVLALGVAVITVVAYAALAERSDYASLRRRQLDLWAGATACLCFGAIVFGGVAARAGQAAPPPRPTLAVPERLPEDRVGEPVGAVAVADAPDAEPPAAPPVGLLAPPAVAPPASEGAPIEAAAVSGVPEGQDPEAAEPENLDPAGAPPGQVPVGGGAQPLPPGPAATAQIPPGRPTDAAVAAPATSTIVARVATRPAAPRVPPSPTDRPPPPTATEAPPPLPTLVPNCGDPSGAQLAMRELSASADREGSDLVVHFGARVVNDSDYPLTLSDVSAAALNQTAGSEQYGHVRLADISVEPGAAIDLDGAVQLKKLPPPFGRTELCVSFVLESCGQRADRTVRQCAAVRGF